jgi:dipeptidyl aminopeptidase/acylaminoacyl peptidase
MTRRDVMTAAILFPCLINGAATARAQQPAAQARPSRQYTIEQFLATTAISSPSISADGSHVLFTSDASGIPNVYTVPFAGGAVVPLTRSTTDSTFAVSYFPKDDRVLFTHDHGGDERNHLYVLDKGVVTDLTPGTKLKAEFIGWSRDDSSFFAMTNERDPRYFDVYRHDAGDYKRSVVYENSGGYQPSGVSGDGRWVALDKPKSTSDSDIYLWDTANRVMTHITPHSVPATFRTAQFDPGSQWLYFLTNEGGEFTRVKRYQLTTGKHEDVEAADWDLVFSRFSHGGRYRVTAVNEDGRTVIRLHDTTTGKLVPMPKLPEGDVTAVAIARDEDRLVISLSGDRSPTNLYSAAIGGPDATRLTEALSKEIDPADLVESQVVRFKASDGLTIPSIFFKPHQASPQHKVPALVWVHGGPGGQTRKGYNAFIQFLVNHGYAVLGINNRGSSGYGQKFFTADDRKHGHEPLRDCVEARAYLSGLPYVDPERIGIIGGSYGGYMVLAALAFEPQAFVLGVDIFGVSNWLRTLESIPPYWEAQRLALYQEIGDPVKDRDMLRAISPVFHADKIRRPLMVLQGKNDPRVIKPESDDIVAAVKAAGVPVEYIVFDDEGHGFTKKKNQIEGYGAVLHFLDKHMAHRGASPTAP